jgi:YD repeat-containing protein
MSTISPTSTVLAQRKNAAELCRRIDGIISLIPEAFDGKRLLVRKLRIIQTAAKETLHEDVVRLMWDAAGNLLNEELPNGDLHPWAKNVARILWPPE